MQFRKDKKPYSLIKKNNKWWVNLPVREETEQEIKIKGEYAIWEADEESVIGSGGNHSVSQDEYKTPYNATLYNAFHFGANMFKQSTDFVAINWMVPITAKNEAFVKQYCNAYMRQSEYSEESVGRICWSEDIYIKKGTPATLMFESKAENIPDLTFEAYRFLALGGLDNLPDKLSSEGYTNLRD